MDNITTKTIKLKNDISLVSVDGANALLDIENKCFFEPNETAYFLLKRIEEGATSTELIDELISEYVVSITTSTSDVDRFISQLLRLNLLETETQPFKAQRSSKDRLEKKLYIPPEIVNQQELTVSAAVTAFTAAPNFV